MADRPRGGGSSRPVTRRRAPRRGRRSWRDLFAIPRPALALAATLLVAVAVGAYAIGAGGGDDGTETVTAQGQAPPGATAIVERTGDRGILRVSGLPQRTDGIYEVWIERDGQVVPSTLFQVHRNGTGAAAIPDGLGGRGSGDGHARAAGRQRKAHAPRR